MVEPGLVDKNVGGQAATEIVADFTDGGKKKRLLGVAVIRDKSAATLSFVTETTDFDELRGAFDAIVENFQLK